jgi:hypothetical protein
MQASLKPANHALYAKTQGRGAVGKFGESLWRGARRPSNLSKHDAQIFAGTIVPPKSAPLCASKKPGYLRTNQTHPNSFGAKCPTIPLNPSSADGVARGFGGSELLIAT